MSWRRSGDLAPAKEITMKITKIRIRNYRSIRDSNDIYLEEKITILAGKNESGKTAILHALTDFDPNREIRSSAKPIEYKTLPEIIVTFSVSNEQINKTLTSIGIKYAQSNDLNLEISKVYPDKYSLSTNTLEWLTSIIDRHHESLINSAKKILVDLEKPLREIVDIKQGIPNIPAESNDEAVISNFSDFIKEVMLKYDTLVHDKNTDKIIQPLGQLEKIVSELKRKSSLTTEFINAIKKLIPTFIYFDSFDSLSPYELPLNEVDTKQAAKDFFTIAGIDLAYLTNPNTTLQEKRNDLAGKSTVITGDFLDYWAQDRVELMASLDANNVIFGFREGDKSEEFTMEQRSKGFQWYLSFYMQLKLHQGSKQKYLLIDEPGLYLHAKAQMDVLKVLEARSADIPIIFSTHSPYLIEYDKLFRVVNSTRKCNG